MMKIGFFSSTLALCFLMLPAPPVLATTLLYKILDALVNESDGIVLGTITRIESDMDKEGNIYTYVTLQQINVLHGAYEGKEFTLRIEGGHVGRQGVYIPGSPNFAEREKWILFVKGNGRHIVPLVGWSQGAFRVEKEAESGNEIIADPYGNRIFGIKGSDLLKERRVAPDVEIMDRKGPVGVYGELPRGEVRGIEPVEGAQQPEKEEALKGVRAMTLESFLKELQERAKAKKVAPPPLVSVSIGEKREPLERDDARPKPQKEESEIKQAPNAEPSRGELPLPITSEDEKRKAGQAEEKESKRK
jgi:hypothetical protein